MSLFCWNCHGLRNQQTVQELEGMVCSQDPAVAFLAKTWPDEARQSSICDFLRLDFKFGVSRISWGGGLTLLQKHDIDLVVEDSSLNYIDATFNRGKENSQRFTRFYGFLETSKHPESQDILSRLQHCNPLPWLCLGDFNEIIRIQEKLGGPLRPNSQMQDFCDVLDECGFRDLGFMGNKFTWAEQFVDGSSIWE